MEFEYIANLVAICTGLVAFLYAVFSFVATNRAEHLKIIQGLDTIVKDCHETNIQSRLELKENHKQFSKIVERLITTKQYGSEMVNK